MKKILSAVLAAMMLVATLGGCLQSVSPADDGSADTLNAVKLFSMAAGEDGSADNGFATSKIFDPETGCLTLEAYAKAKLVSTTVRQPLDAVLVLDLSGSMSESVSESTYNAASRTSFSYRNLSSTYYALYNGEYYPVQRGCSTGTILIFDYNYDCYAYIEVGGKTLYLHGSTIDETKVTFSGETDAIWNGTLYTYGQQSKIEALKTAVNAFIDTVHEDAVMNDVDHRIAIVKFADNSYYSDDHLAEGNHRQQSLFGSGSNYSELVKNVTNVKDDAGVTDLKEAVAALTPNGATAADYGMTIAGEVLGQETVTDEERNSSKVVLMFTDGDPNHSSGFSGTVASSTVAKAKDMKDNGATVYTIGIFRTLDANTKKYMDATSSNKPDATKYSDGSDEITGYFKNASDGNQLTDIFTSIAEEAVEGLTSLDETAVVMDEMTEFFEIPKDSSGHIDKSLIKVYTADYDASTDSFGEKSLLAGAEIKVETSEVTGLDRVYVSGFDFSAHWCGEGATDGQKLIIEIPIDTTSIVVNLEDAEWCEKHGVKNLGNGKYVFNTNSALSGIYVNGEQVDDFDPIENFEQPETVLYTVKYSDPLNNTVPGDTVKEPGATVTVADGLTTDGVTFLGWSMNGEIVSGTFTMPEANVTLTAVWEAAVTYDFNGGNGAEGVDYTSQVHTPYGTSVNLLAAPSKTGHTFNGWKYNDTLYDAGDSYTVNTDTAFVADYTVNKYSYKYEYYIQNAEGTGWTLKEDGTDEADYGTTVTIEEKTFAGFTLDKSVEDTLASAVMPDNDDTVLKLFYTRNEIKVTIVHSSNGESEEVVIKYNDDGTLDALDITRYVKNAYMYGGIFADETFAAALSDIDGKNGMEIAPVNGATYYLKEVSRYLYNNVSFITVWRPEVVSGKFCITDIYARAQLESKNIIGFGFTADGDFGEGDYFVAVDTEKAIGSSCTVKDDFGNDADATVTVNGKDYNTLTGSDGLWTLAVITPEKNSQEVEYDDCYGGGEYTYFKAGEMTVSAYYVTVDGIRVVNTSKVLTVVDGAKAPKLASEFLAADALCSVYEAE